MLIILVGLIKQKYFSYKFIRVFLLIKPTQVLLCFTVNLFDEIFIENILKSSHKQRAESFWREEESMSTTRGSSCSCSLLPSRSFQLFVRLRRKTLSFSL